MFEVWFEVVSNCLRFDLRLSHIVLNISVFHAFAFEVWFEVFSQTV